LDLFGGGVGFIKDPVRPAASAECPGEFSFKWLPYVSGIGSQVSENELNDRRNYSRRYA